MASYPSGDHENASKVFYTPYSSFILHPFQNSPSRSKQSMPIRNKQLQLTTHLVQSSIKQNKINQNYMRETRIVTRKIH